MRKGSSLKGHSLSGSTLIAPSDIVKPRRSTVELEKEHL